MPLRSRNSDTRINGMQVNDLFNSEEENMRGALLYNGNSSYNRRGYEILNFLGIEKLLNQLDMR